MEQQQQQNGEQQKPAPTQEEHDAAMAAKYRAQLAGGGAAVNPEDNPPRKAERPAHIPEKFWDADKGEVRLEDMAKSYAELEKKASQPPKPPEKQGSEGTEQGTKEGEGGNTNVDPVAEAVKAFSGLRDKATEMIARGEALDDATYAGFEKHGLSREDINTFIAGQEAIGTLAKMEVHNAVGGEEAYKAMIEWARANYSEAEVSVYDRDIHSGDPAVRLTAARGLAARYEQATGKSGKSVTEKGGARTREGFASGAEMREAMKDPRYAKDPAYREEVARKVAAARAAGVDLMTM